MPSNKKRPGLSIGSRPLLLCGLAVLCSACLSALITASLMADTHPPATRAPHARDTNRLARELERHQQVTAETQTALERVQTELETLRQDYQTLLTRQAELRRKLMAAREELQQLRTHNGT